MFQPRGRRDIYLPAGAWYDYWTDRRFDGARWISYKAELATLPLFARAGAIIPMGPALQFANERAWDPLDFEIYIGRPGTADYELWPDGRRLNFRLTVNEESVRLDGGPLDYPAKVGVHRPSAQPIVGRLGEQIPVR
jgi:alpha-glucosidase (family GH31 glycosyl hydrolase)